MTTSVDACEWGPTFGVPDDAVTCVLAGEGLVPGSYEDEAAEDDGGRGAAAIRALTAAIAGRRGSPLAALADHAIEVPVGAEVLSGSTRLKAGTAQKIVLNAFSTALMVRRGRTVGGLMAGMRVSNTTLRARAVSVCVQALGCDEDAARSVLIDAGWELDAALVMLAAGMTAVEARERLRATGGAISEAMA